MSVVISKMDQKTSVTKFVIDEKPFYVSTIWKPNENDLFHINLYDGDKTWSGRFSYEFAKKYKERFDETEQQYYDYVKQGLSKHDDFSYSFGLQADDQNSATFCWKKKFHDSQTGVATLVHGSVPLHVDQVTKSKDYLLDFLLAENKHLRDTIDSLTSKNTHLERDLNTCRQDLDKFVDMKTTLETSLYGKFVQLLTAKKRRIQMLEENISNITARESKKEMNDLD